MRNLLVLTFLAVLLSLTTGQTLIAQSCPTPSGDLPTCSYTAENGKCQLTINRTNPVTPPTIYVKRGCSVTVSVSDTSPFEDLTLDWKSSTIIIPPDTFQNLLSALSGNVGKFTDIV